MLALKQTQAHTLRENYSHRNLPHFSLTQENVLFSTTGLSGLFWGVGGGGWKLRLQQQYTEEADMEKQTTRIINYEQLLCH